MWMQTFVSSELILKNIDHLMIDLFEPVPLVQTFHNFVVNEVHGFSRYQYFYMTSASFLPSLKALSL